MSLFASFATSDSNQEAASATGRASVWVNHKSDQDMTHWCPDEGLPEVYFSSSDDDTSTVKREKDDEDVVFIQHLPSTKRRLCSASQPSHLQLHHPASHFCHETPAGCVGHEPAAAPAPHVATGSQCAYTFTHYRRCSVDIDAALKAKDANALLAVLSCIHLHLQVMAPPRPNHKIREYVTHLSSPETAPNFVLGALVCPVARAIQERWSGDACMISARTKKKGKSVSKKKAKVIEGKKKKKKNAALYTSCTETKLGTCERRERGLSEHNREKVLQSVNIACAKPGCRRVFTSLSSMLHHLRDKHKVLDPRLTSKMKKEKMPSNWLFLEKGSEPSIETVSHSSAATAAVLQIASVSNGLSGAR
jgi:hypothetical protein